MVEPTVTISLKDYKELEEKINHLKKYHIQKFIEKKLSKNKKMFVNEMVIQTDKIHDYIHRVYGEDVDILQESNTKERYFLEDTRDILTDYDGYKTEQQLKGLIDETKRRLTAYLNGTIKEYE